jgi:transaldolase
MKATQMLHERGQSLWLDNMTRDLIDTGTLARYIDELSITGLTSNSTIFEHAITHSHAHDAAIGRRVQQGKGARSCSSSWRSRTCGARRTSFVPGASGPRAWTAGCRWRSRPCWPTTAGARSRRRGLSTPGRRGRVMIKIPGTPEGLPAIEEAIVAGVPVNVTLLFSREQYLAAVEAYLRGVERRIANGLDPAVGSVASVFVSRWDAAVADRAPAALRNRLGIAIAQRTYRAARELLGGGSWRAMSSVRASADGVHPVRGECPHVLADRARRTIPWSPAAFQPPGRTSWRRRSGSRSRSGAAGREARSWCGTSRRPGDGPRWWLAP